MRLSTRYSAATLFVLLLATTLGASDVAKADVINPTYNSQTPGGVANIVQTLGKLSGRITKIRIYGRGSGSAVGGYAQLQFVQCDSDFGGLDTGEFDAGCAFTQLDPVWTPSDTEWVEFNTDIRLDSTRYSLLYFYRDWILRGNSFDSYRAGHIGSRGSPNSYDNIGDLVDVSFIIYGATQDLLTGTITVVKEAIPDSPVRDFAFGGTLGSFLLDDDGDRTELEHTLPKRKRFADLAPGFYSVYELRAPGWRLTGLECVDPSGGTSVNLVAATAAIHVSASENVVCTFTNERTSDYVLYEQRDSSAYYEDFRTFSAVQFLGNGLSGRITEVCVKVSSPDHGFFKWYMGWNLNPPNDWNPAGYIFADNDVLISPGENAQTICRSVDTVLQPNHYYFFVIGTQRFGARVRVYGSGDSNAWRTSVEDSKRFAGAWVDTQPLRDVWFQIISEPESEPEPPNLPKTIVFVPGFAGSELRKVDDAFLPPLWWQGVFHPQAASLIPWLAVRSAPPSDNGNTPVFDSVRATGIITLPVLGYGGIVSELASWDEAGEADFVPFAYDWRLGLEKAALALESRVVGEALAGQCGSREVWLVGHSTGGLVIKEMLRNMRLGGRDPESCFGGGGVFFLATPHEGAPKAIGALIDPDLFFGDFVGELTQPPADRELAHAINNFQTAWDLVPRAGSPHPGAREAWFAPGLIKNVADDELNWALDQKAARDTSLGASVGSMPVYNVFGASESTPASYGPGQCVGFRALLGYRNTDRSAHLDEVTRGDGTVPAWSGSWQDGGLPVRSQYSLPGTGHTELANSEAVLALIRSVVVNGIEYPDPASPLRHGQAALSDATREMPAMWFIRTCSPVTVQARFGGSVTGDRPDGTVVNEIPGAVVSIGGWGGDKQRTIAFPADSAQPAPVFSLTATRDGVAAVFLTEPEGPEQRFAAFKVRDGDLVALERGASGWHAAVDEGGDGTVDRLVEANDTTPPTLTAHVSGTLGREGWYVSDVIVAWTLDDPESGIASNSGCDTTIIREDTAGITLTCEASSGGGTASRSVTVKRDATSPTLSCSARPTTLWPPSHSLVAVTAFIEVGDATSGPSGFILTSATSNEPDNGLGDGDLPSDIQGFAVGTDDAAGQLRAERSGRGHGRIYELRYRGVDAAGNTATCDVKVSVPHDRR